MSENQSSKRIWQILTVVFGLGLLFFILNTFIPGFQPVKSVEYQSLETEKAELDMSYSTALQQIEEQEMKIDELRGINDELDAKIAERDEEISKIKAEIDRIRSKKNASDAEVAKMKSLINQLQSENDSFIAQIQQLAEEKKILEEKNIVLTQKIDTISSEKSQLEKEKAFLGKKVELGSLLKTNGLYATGIKDKNSGKEVETDRVNKLDKIRVCYETGTNLVREAGSATMYLRLISPQGTTISVESMGSGVLTNNEGEEIQYTRSISFDYKGDNKKICIDWSQNIFNPGNYKAEVYQDGYLVGKTEFTLK